MASWDVFKPDVLVHVPAAPDPLVEMALRRAARELCSIARVLRRWCDCTETPADSGIYVITIPTDLQPFRLERVTAAGVPVEVVPAHWHQDDPESGSSTLLTGATPLPAGPASFTSTSGTLTADVRAMVALRPTYDAATCDDFLADLYLEAIAAGAARNLLSTRGAPWFDPAGASIQAGAFEAALGRSITDAARGNTGRHGRPRPTWF